MSEGISIEQVAEWLRARGLASTSLELYMEIQRCGQTPYEPLLEAAKQFTQKMVDPSSVAAAASSRRSRTNQEVVSDTTTGISSADRLRQCAREFLESNSAAELALLTLEVTREYQRQHRETDGGHGAEPGVAAAAASSAAAAEELREVAAQSADREALRSTVRLLAERLPSVVDAVDPAHRDLLLPLLRVVALHAESSAVRTAARHRLLALYRRPTRDQRAALTAEWRRIAATVPRRAMESEVIPDLYAMVNAHAWERRVLALDCGTALAPLLVRCAPSVAASLRQGLLRSLSEDEAAEVRAEVPACLVALWGPSPERAASDCTPERTPARSNTEAPRGDDSTSSGGTFEMELIIRLALDPQSPAVRRAALLEIREVVLSKCAADGVLLSRFIPLLLAFIRLDVVALQPARLNRHSDGSREGREGPACARHTADADSASVSLALNNIAVLIRLVSSSLQFARALVEQHAAENSSDATRQLSLVYHSFSTVVLPTVFSLLPCLVSNPFTNSSLKHDSIPTFSPPLCALAASIACIVSVFTHEQRGNVLRLLCDGFPTQQPHHAIRGASSDGSPTVATKATRVSSSTEEGELIGRLTVFYTLLARLAGEGVDFGTSEIPALVLSSSTAAAPASTAVPASVSAQALVVGSFVRGGALAGVALQLRLDVCSRCLAHLFSVEAGGGGLGSLTAGVLAILWHCATAPEIVTRHHAVSLIAGTCAFLQDSAAQIVHVTPPLLALLNDPDEGVQEMAVKALISTCATVAGDATLQDSLLQPTFATVELSGCCSELTRTLLRHWEMQVGAIPSEPRERHLYPFLATLMTQLQRHAPSHTSDAEAWTATMSLLAALLLAISRCAVVTPTAVTEHLVPGITHLSSAPLQRLLSSATQTRDAWRAVTAAYEPFIHPAPPPVGMDATMLLNRFRDEIKRRL